MYRDFLDHYGKNLLWWLVLSLTLAVLCLFELGVSSIRKTFWPTDTEVFQELQKDPIIRQRFEDTVRDEKDDHAAMVKAEREQREGEILEILNRPRVMDGAATIIGRKSGSLRRRVGSLSGEVSPKTMGVRQSMDIAEVLGRS